MPGFRCRNLLGTRGYPQVMHENEIAKERGGIRILNYSNHVATDIFPWNRWCPVDRPGVCFPSSHDLSYIKLWDYGSPLSEQGPLGWKYGILQLIGGLLGLLSLWRLRHTIRLEASRLNEAPKEGEGAMGSQGPSLCKVRQMLAHAKLGSSSTAFQVGNVFYEVLFSGVNLHDPAANFAYFGFAVTTLVLGSIALMISCELFFSIEELSDGLKCVLAERLTIHFRLIRILYMASLISWLCSMFFSSEVVGLKISSRQIHQMSMINHGHHCGSSPFSLYTCGKKKG